MYTLFWVNSRLNFCTVPRSESYLPLVFLWDCPVICSHDTLQDWVLQETWYTWQFCCWDCISFPCKALFFKTLLGSSFYFRLFFVIWVSFSRLLENLDKRDDWQPPRIQHSWGESYAFCLLHAISSENLDCNLTWYHLFRIMRFCLVYERLICGGFFCFVVGGFLVDWLGGCVIYFFSSFIFFSVFFLFFFLFPFSFSLFPFSFFSFLFFLCFFFFLFSSSFSLFLLFLFSSWFFSFLFFFFS